ncbi:MAG: hypothetical protein HZLCBSQH_000967 [Candidatus Fervidibacterota bacterium]
MSSTVTLRCRKSRLRRDDDLQDAVQGGSVQRTSIGDAEIGNRFPIGCRQSVNGVCAQPDGAAHPCGVAAVGLEMAIVTSQSSFGDAVGRKGQKSSGGAVG